MISSQTSAAKGTLAGLIDRAGEKIAGAIKVASEKTGVDFSYMMQQAQVESSFKANAKASTSSATGLYQFIDSTWLQMVNKYGDKHGLGDLAAQISDSGKVASKAVKKEILALRNDPQICSIMAGELAAENKSYLQSCTKADIGSTELYLAHFMGPGSASKFINAMDKSPTAKAADLFPTAADANKNIFYAANGKPRSLSEVYSLFDKKFQIEQGQTTSCDATAAMASLMASSLNSTSTNSTTNQLAKAEASMPTMKVTPAMKKSLARPAALDKTTQQNTAYNAHNSYGGIPGLKSLAILPVDVLALMKMDDHSENDRYNG